MNLQTMSIILIIIILPITLILSAYTKIQIDTISLQTMYKTKLKDATYDAVVAFQINTVHNTYSTVSDSMRRDISAVIQTFFTDLATNLGMSGTNKENIKPYIPAIVFTLYDGYYIYSPSVSHTEDDGGKNEKTVYEHVLKPYIYYTARYVNETQGIDVVVNYSLDNYIVVTGQLGEEYVTKAGYLINPSNIPVVNNQEKLERRLPVTTIIYTDNENKSFVNDTLTFDINVADMYVTNENMNSDRLSNGNLLMNTDLFKTPEQLSVNQGIARNRENVEKIRISRELLQAELDKILTNDLSLIATVKGNILKKFYKPSYIIGDVTQEKFVEGDYSLGFYVDPSTPSYYIQADSAKQYYDKALEFTNWVNNSLLSTIKASDAVRPDGSKYEFADRYIFKLGNENDPTDTASIFNDHRRDVIKSSIQYNLSQAIASYSENSENLGTTANFQMPILTEDEWNQVLNNVCLITFMQGIQVGTKMFNDYCIVTSTKNKEYVSPDSIYYVNPGKIEADGVSYYHKIDCPYLDDSMEIVGYRNSDFDRMSYEVENQVSNVEHEDKKIKEINYSERDKKYYYYMHPEYACYYCIVSQSSDKRINWRKPEYVERQKAYYTAMAREKFNFYKTNSYF